MKPVMKAHMKANNTKDQLISTIEQKENLLADYKEAHAEIVIDLKAKSALKDAKIQDLAQEVERLKADRVKRQSAVDQGLYQLEAYRIVLADVHDNIKINTQAVQ